MRIIKEGTVPNLEYVFNCGYCGCVFAITDYELHQTPYVNKGSYKCPTCGTQVYGYKTQEAEIEPKSELEPEENIVVDE